MPCCRKSSSDSAPKVTTPKPKASAKPAKTAVSSKAKVQKKSK